MKLPDGKVRFRRKSLNAPGHAHELTFSCFRGLPLLARDRTRQWLVDAIARARDRCEFDLWAYVVMPTHAHLLIHPRRSDYEISTILKAIKQPIGRRAIHYLRTHSPAWLERVAVRNSDGHDEHRFWQAGGGYDRNIVEPETLLHAIEYIHANPVRKQLCDASTDWRWSSAAWYQGNRDVPLAIDPLPPL